MGDCCSTKNTESESQPTKADSDGEKKGSGDDKPKVAEPAKVKTPEKVPTPEKLSEIDVKDIADDM